MERVIKFRAWDGKKMILPQYSDWEDFFIEPDGGVYKMEETRSYESWREKVSIPSWFLIMQFTGLHDKNGKEIYEGDIVRCWWLAELGMTVKEFEVVGIVHYQPAIAAYIAEFKEPIKESINGDMVYEEEQLQLRREFDTDESISFEIIGNIYENPELLK